MSQNTTEGSLPSMSVPTPFLSTLAITHGERKLDALLIREFCCLAVVACSALHEIACPRKMICVLACVYWNNFRSGDSNPLIKKTKNAQKKSF
jgi:hypothetical protein